MLSLKAVFRFHFLFFSSWNFVGSKSNVNTPCRDVLFLGPRIGGASILIPSNALGPVASMLTAYNAEPRRHRSPKSSHRSDPSAHGGVPARQAVHLHTWSEPSCSHPAAYLSHPLKNIRKTTHSNPFFPKREVATITLIALPTYAGTTLVRPISTTPNRPRPHL